MKSQPGFELGSMGVAYRAPHRQRGLRIHESVEVNAMPNDNPQALVCEAVNTTLTHQPVILKIYPTARFIGLIVRDVLMRQPETWLLGRYEQDGVAVQSMTYLRV
jgi:hypothetical protein